MSELNFKELLHYGKQPVVENRYKQPIQCSGYCISCEEKNLLKNSKHVLDQMSHGADSWDFEQLIGELPIPNNNTPIIFLLESPGGYYLNGEPKNYNGISKQPPVNHYYWTPDLKEWPTDPYSLKNLYGPYFAYLLFKHKIKNAYFTNAIKCSLCSLANKDKKQFIPYRIVKTADYRDTMIRNNCYDLFLSREIKIHDPKICFCFGKKVKQMSYYLDFKSKYPEMKCYYLIHPAARMSRKTIIEKNDRQIEKILKK